MENYYIIFLILGLCFVGPSLQQDQCNDDVNACTVRFTTDQQAQAASGFNLTAICSTVNTFMVCVNNVLRPCDVVTKNTLKSAVDQLINIYTSSPYGCELEIVDTFEYGNCSQQVTKCAFFKYDAEEHRDNSTQACQDFTNFVDCMKENTTACTGAEQVEITQSIQNNTETFSQCPYACNQPDLVCTTVSSTSTVSTETVFVSVDPSASSIMVSDLDLSEYSYQVTLAPSDAFYDPSEVLSLYNGDATDFYSPAISQDLFTESDYLMEETGSVILPTATSDNLGSTEGLDLDSAVSAVPDTTSSTPITTFISITKSTSVATATPTSTTKVKPTPIAMQPTSSSYVQDTRKPSASVTPVSYDTTPVSVSTPSSSNTRTTVTPQTSATTQPPSATAKPTTKATDLSSTTAKPSSTTGKSSSTPKVRVESTTTSDTRKETTPKVTSKSPVSTTVKQQETTPPSKTPRPSVPPTRKTTTDFPTPNYDSAGSILGQSATVILISLVLWFIA